MVFLRLRAKELIDLEVGQDGVLRLQDLHLGEIISAPEVVFDVVYSRIMNPDVVFFLEMLIWKDSLEGSAMREVVW